MGLPFGLQRPMDQLSHKHTRNTRTRDSKDQKGRQRNNWNSVKVHLSDASNVARVRSRTGYLQFGKNYYYYVPNKNVKLLFAI